VLFTVKPLRGLGSLVNSNPKSQIPIPIAIGTKFQHPNSALLFSEAIEALSFSPFYPEFQGFNACGLDESKPDLIAGSYT